MPRPVREDNPRHLIRGEPMEISVRPTLKLAGAALSASTIALAVGVAPPPDIWHPQHNERIAVQAAVPAQPPMSLTASDLRLMAAAQALVLDPTPTLVSTPSLIALANAIDNAYEAIEPWVRYGFEVASDVVAWIPWVGIFANQIMVVYNFAESLINSGVFNSTDWLRGDGSALKNVADWVVDLGLAVVWLGIDEVGAWIPLPPIGFYPPRPPAADLPEGFLGDAVVGASHLLADVSNGIWNIWEPIRGGIDRTVGAVSDLLDAVSWVPFVPLINVELTAGWDLIAGGVDALTGFAHDMINAGDQFVTDAIHGAGLVAAIINAFDNTVNSIADRAGQAWQAVVDWVQAQVDFFLAPFGAAVEQAPPPIVETADPQNSRQSLTLSAAVTVGSTDDAVTADRMGAEASGSAEGAVPDTVDLSQPPEETAEEQPVPDEDVTMPDAGTVPVPAADGAPIEEVGPADDDILGEVGEGTLDEADDGGTVEETSGTKDAGDDVEATEDAEPATETTAPDSPRARGSSADPGAQAPPGGAEAAGGARDAA